MATKKEYAMEERYFPTGQKTGRWTEIWAGREGETIQLKVVELESGIPYRVCPSDGTPSFHLTMEQYATAREEGIAL